jgi:hypothetical protein
LTGYSERALLQAISFKASNFTNGKKTLAYELEDDRFSVSFRFVTIMDLYFSVELLRIPSSGRAESVQIAAL